MILRLWFDITVSHDDEDWSEGMFALTNPVISGSGEDLKVDYDDVKLFLTSDDGINEYEGGITSWHSNNMSASEIFESVLNSYLRGDNTGTSPYGDSWAFFNRITELRLVENYLLVKFPQISVGSIDMYSLQLAVSGRNYYSHEDEFMMLDDDNAIVTNYECFYSNAMGEDLADIIQKKLDCIYMGNDAKCWIKAEGEDYIVKNYRRENV